MPIYPLNPRGVTVREVAERVNALIRATAPTARGTVTLPNGLTSTTVTEPGLVAAPGTSFVALAPLTAEAAAALAAGTVYAAEVSAAGSFTIHHPADLAADVVRFGWLVVQG